MRRRFSCRSRPRGVLKETAKVAHSKKTQPSAPLQTSFSAQPRVHPCPNKHGDSNGYESVRARRFRRGHVSAYRWLRYQAQNHSFKNGNKKSPALELRAGDHESVIASALFADAFNKGLKFAPARWMPQLPQRLGFNLANPLTRNLEALSHLFQSVLGPIFQAEPHLDHTLFPGSQRPQYLGCVLLQVHADNGFGRRNRLAILDKVTQVRIFFLANGSLKRDRLLCDLQHFPDLCYRNIHPASNLHSRRFASHLLHQLPRSTDQLVNRFDHVHRNTNGPGLIGDRTRNRLANPPSGIG